jgi:hypothetical protein
MKAPKVVVHKPRSENVEVAPLSSQRCAPAADSPKPAMFDETTELLIGRRRAFIMLTGYPDSFTD